MRKSWKNLPQEKLERGNVEILEILDKKHIGISILKIFPESEIKFHMHEKDMEFYIGIFCKVWDFCRKGCGHGMRSNLKKIIYVLSIKLR